MNAIWLLLFYHNSMIPQKLSLINFLSYRETSLDFTRLHTACMCGANGAGKSSLLEAIGWVVWGNSRVASEEDLIHLGEKEMRVDFSFISHGNLYRVIRSRRRGQSGNLEFQIAVNPPEVIHNWDEIQFKVLTERGMRGTQQKILEYLKLDYYICFYKKQTFNLAALNIACKINFNFLFVF